MIRYHSVTQSKVLLNRLLQKYRTWTYLCIVSKALLIECSSRSVNLVVADTVSGEEVVAVDDAVRRISKLVHVADRGQVHCRLLQSVVVEQCYLKTS